MSMEEGHRRVDAPMPPAFSSHAVRSEPANPPACPVQLPSSRGNVPVRGGARKDKNPGEAEGRL